MTILHRIGGRWQAGALDTDREREWASTEPNLEGDAVSDQEEPDPPGLEEPSEELRALALFADAIADPALRNQTADPLELLRSVAGEKWDSFQPDVRRGLIDLLDGMTREELQVLARLQRHMVLIDPDGTLGLTEKVKTGSHKTLAKL
jgi:hypothetical protein